MNNKNLDSLEPLKKVLHGLKEQERKLSFLVAQHRRRAQDELLKADTLEEHIGRIQGLIDDVNLEIKKITNE